MPIPPPLLKEATAYLSPEELHDVRDAYEFARSMYEGALLIHAEKVARLLLHLHPDARTIITALLQYAETKEHLQHIERRFGKKVLRTISSLSVLEQGSGRSTTHSKSYVQKMALALSEDIRVILIWLHNCWHQLQQQVIPDPKRQRALAREVLDVFAPLAARLGVYSLKYTLETLAFGILYPQEAEDIKEGLEKLRKEQGSFLADNSRVLRRLFLHEGKKVEISAREKHPYSIFRKMQQKGVSSMTDLHDLFGLRIIVENEEECYHTLGIIHRTYRPILHRVKDYIAFPKPNGYRSIHTTVLGLHEKAAALPVEIQIRTREMNEQAEFGVAAHWNYKEGGKEDMTHHGTWQERMRAIAKLSTGTSAGEEVLSDILSDRIYVLTPKGDPIELPKGATPLDFAFRVHTDVGLCFRSAKVNGTIARIDQHLENGDMIEILKQKDPRPSHQWLQIVRTHEARSKLRGFFRIDQAPEVPDTRSAEQKHWRKSGIPVKAVSKISSSENLVVLDADAALPHRIAKCCNPKDDETLPVKIVGFVTRTGIVNIHRRDCRMLQDANVERLIRAHFSRIAAPAKVRVTSRAGGKVLSRPSSDI